MSDELLMKIACALNDALQALPSSGYESQREAQARALVAALESRGLRISGGAR